MFAVQLAKHFGASVTAVCSTGMRRLPEGGAGHFRKSCTPQEVPERLASNARPSPHTLSIEGWRTTGFSS